MGVRRARNGTQFTVIPNGTLQDPRISEQARGILVKVLSRPTDWHVSVAHLVNETQRSRVPIGRDGMRAILRELMHAGYVHREQARGEDGQLGEIDYVFYPEPPATAEPSPGEPAPAEPATAETPPTENRDIQKTERDKHRGGEAASADKEENSGGCPRYSLGLDFDRNCTHDTKTQSGTRFDDWWQHYPVKRGKKKAREAWKRKKLDAIADRLIEDVKSRLNQDRDWLRGFIPHPTTYLNGERWEDEYGDAAHHRHESNGASAREQAREYLQGEGLL